MKDDWFEWMVLGVVMCSFIIACSKGCEYEHKESMARIQKGVPK